MGHIHAAAMAEYAKDAAETDKPWERWEFPSTMRGITHLCIDTQFGWQTISTVVNLKQS